MMTRLFLDTNIVVDLLDRRQLSRIAVVDERTVDALLAVYPSIDITVMGFPRGWESEPLWQ